MLATVATVNPAWPVDRPSGVCVGLIIYKKTVGGWSRVRRQKHSSLKLRLLLLTKTKHSNLYLFLLKPPTFCFLFSTFPSPNPLPFYPSPLFSKFHGPLLTPSTNDLFLFPSSLSIPLHLPTRPSKDPAHEEHHRSCRKKHFHKLPSDRLPILLHQLVQGGAPASWQPSPGELHSLQFCLKLRRITTMISPDIFFIQRCKMSICILWFRCLSRPCTVYSIRPLIMHSFDSFCNHITYMYYKIHDYLYWKWLNCCMAHFLGTRQQRGRPSSPWLSSFKISEMEQNYLLEFKLFYKVLNGKSGWYISEFDLKVFYFQHF